MLKAQQTHLLAAGSKLMSCTALWENYRAQQGGHRRVHGSYQALKSLRGLNIPGASLRTEGSSDDIGVPGGCGEYQSQRYSISPLSQRDNGLTCSIRSLSGIQKLKHSNSGADKLPAEPENVHLQHEGSLYSHLSLTLPRGAPEGLAQTQGFWLKSKPLLVTTAALRDKEDGSVSFRSPPECGSCHRTGR